MLLRINSDDEIENLLVGILCLAMGVWAIYASYKNKESFFNSFKAWLIVALFGRTGARIFYAALGGLLIVLAFKLLFMYFG